MRLSRLRPYLTLVPFAVYALALVPVQMAAVRFGWGLARRLPVHFHRLALRALGVKVAMVGAPERSRPLLIASNHASWLDIVILGSILPVSFVAKAEVAQWPIFGTLARLQRSVFVDRERRHSTGGTAAEIADRLSDGDAIVLFAEGTTSDGNTILPFRSALLGAARSAIDAGGHSHVSVQPVSITYTRLHGLPMGRQWRPLVAWVGDEDLPPHLMGLAREGAVDVTVSFGDATAFDRDGDRKRITREAETSVRTMMTRALRG